MSKEKRSRSYSINSESDDSIYSASDLEVQEILGTLKDLNLEKPLKKKGKSENSENLDSVDNNTDIIGTNNDADNSLNESIQNLNYLVGTLSTDIGIKIKSNNETTISLILTECLSIFKDNYNEINNPAIKEKLFMDIANILRRINSKLDNSSSHVIVKDRINEIHNYMLSQLYKGGRRRKKKNSKKTTKRKRKNKRVTKKNKRT